MSLRLAVTYFMIGRSQKATFLQKHVCNIWQLVTFVETDHTSFDCVRQQNIWIFLTDLNIQQIHSATFFLSKVSFFYDPAHWLFWHFHKVSIPTVKEERCSRTAFPTPGRERSVWNFFQLFRNAVCDTSAKMHFPSLAKLALTPFHSGLPRQLMQGKRQ